MDFKRVIYSLLVVAIFIALWEIALSTLITVKYFPSPEGVIKAAAELAAQGDLEGYSLFEHTWNSLLRVFSGFSAAFVLGVALGLLMGLFPMMYDTMKVIIEPIRFIPPVGWVPLAIVLFVGFSRYVFIIWLGAFFPIFISVLTSIPKVDILLKDAVKVYGGGWLDIVRKVVLPSVLPEILSGSRIALGSAWACIVAAEMIGGETIGLGRLILKYADLMMINEVVVGMLLIGIIGLLCNEVVLRIEKRSFRWRAKVSL
jgi:ABC-type nitrate/sulfonate/bicarbonate transport system permease component